MTPQMSPVRVRFPQPGAKAPCVFSFRCGPAGNAACISAAVYAGVAQLVEHGTRNAVVAGSTPAASSKIALYRISGYLCCQNSIQIWALSSAEESVPLITGWSWVRAPEGPPHAPVAQLAERRLSKPDGRVRAPLGAPCAGVAQLVERRFCKPLVAGSSPVASSNSFLRR